MGWCVFVMPEEAGWSILVPVVGDPLDVPRRYRTPAPAGPESTGPASLSRRQREVLALLADGVTARSIAQLLNLAEPTVRNHIRGILRKLDCHSQLEAVAVALRMNLVPVRRGDPQGAQVPRRAEAPTAPARERSVRPPRQSPI